MPGRTIEASKLNKSFTEQALKIMDICPMSSSDFDSYLKSEEFDAKTDDPETTPYASKYESRKLLESLEFKLNLLYIAKKGANEGENFPEIVCSFAFILYKLGLNFCKTDERTTGESFLLNSIQILKNVGLNPATENNLPQISPYLINLYLSIENYLAVDNYPRDPVFCLKNVCCCNVGSREKDDVKSEEECWLKLERLYTYTLFYMAQIYKNLNQFQQSALYCHETLVRQLNYNDYDPLEWSLNSATLSQYYINNNDVVNFAISRQCLASALAMLDKFPIPEREDEQQQVTNNNDNNRKEKYQQCKADIYRCFAKYGLVLLEKSSKENESEILNKIDEEEIIMFDKLDFNDYLHLITDRLVCDFESAKPVFMAIQNFLNKSKIFYKLDGWTSDYIEIIQDYSKAYKLLAFFELDVDRKCQMHKRRLDLLENLIKELNPIHYLNQCRQIYMDLGDISAEILDLKYEKLEKEISSPPSSNQQLALQSHKISKINYLVQRSIKFYRLFLESYKNRDDKWPEKYDRDQIRPILVAHLALGRLNNKMLTNDKREKIDFCTKAYEQFKFIVNYCENVDQSILDLVNSEYDVSKDLMRLYTVKIDRLRSLPSNRTDFFENKL
uniref:KIF-binding protein n=1 Tax=Romanomermis culicivorax TaxID=13658 RepID=A0A915JFM2_ROMCU